MVVLAYLELVSFHPHTLSTEREKQRKGRQQEEEAKEEDDER
jgi:hypothetical protein